MTMWEKIKEAKGRLIVGILIGTFLAFIALMLIFFVIPDKNQTLFAGIIGIFGTGFGAFIQHIMKTPDKEKVNGGN